MKRRLEGKTLAVVGASYLQLPLVEKARALGVRTICFAWAEGAVCKDVADAFYPISIIDKEAILEVCRRENIDGITTIASDVAVPTVNYVAGALGLVGNSPESSVVCTNKAAMREVLVQGGVRCPFFRKVCSEEEARLAMQETDYPVIIKPCDRSGSMGVTKVNSDEELGDAVRTAVDASFCKAAVLEKFVDIAHELSVEGISWQGEHHILAVTDKVTTGAPHYVELGQHQPSRLPQSVLEEAVRQARMGVQALGIRFGASHPEIMISTTGEVYVTEIGARMGGDFIGSHLVPLSTGYDFLAGVIEIALGSFSGVTFGDKHCAGVWFYSPNTPWVKEMIQQSPRGIVQSELHEEELRELTRSADRAGYFIYQSDTPINAPA